MAIERLSNSPQGHRGAQRETQRTSQTRRHKDTKAGHPRKQTADHADRAEGFFDAALPRLTAETSAISRSPTTGGKPVVSGRKRPSSPCFPPVDVPGARRFRLPFLLIGRGGAIHPTTGRGVARPALYESTVLRFPAVGRQPGPRHGTGSPCPSSVPLRLRASALRKGLGGLVMSSCLRVFVFAMWMAVRLSVSLCLCGFPINVAGRLPIPSSVPNR